MSNISSNSLFHFTSKAEYLIGILEHTFIPRYCYEEITLSDRLERLQVVGAIPMVCFCDISLGQINNHIKTYGSYGIGMTKEWGIKNKLNPLIYINQNSELADSVSKISSSLFNLLCNSCNSDSQNATDEFFKISKFLKPYSGDFNRNKELIKNVRFYNEREWRYIPNLNEVDNIVMSKEDFENPIKLAEENNKLSKYKLSFTPKDIKYIFVKEEKEIHSMIQSLRLIKGQKFDSKTIDILTSKILTTKQIGEDF